MKDGSWVPRRVDCFWERGVEGFCAEMVKVTTLPSAMPTSKFGDLSVKSDATRRERGAARESVLMEIVWRTESVTRSRTEMDDPCQKPMTQMEGRAGESSTQESCWEVMKVF
jgi:hypothetical protein